MRDTIPSIPAIGLTLRSPSRQEKGRGGMEALLVLRDLSCPLHSTSTVSHIRSTSVGQPLGRVKPSVWSVVAMADWRSVTGHGPVCHKPQTQPQTTMAGLATSNYLMLLCMLVCCPAARWIRSLGAGRRRDAPEVLCEVPARGRWPSKGWRSGELFYVAARAAAM